MRTFQDIIKSVYNKIRKITVNRDALLLLNPILIGIFAYSFSEIQTLNKEYLNLIADSFNTANAKIDDLKNKNDSVQYLISFRELQIEVKNKFTKRFNDRKKMFPNSFLDLDQVASDSLLIQEVEITDEIGRLDAYSQENIDYSFRRWTTLKKMLSKEYNLVVFIQRIDETKNKILLDSINRTFRDLQKYNVTLHTISSFKSFSDSALDEIKLKENIIIDQFGNDIDVKLNLTKIKTNEVKSELKFYKIIRIISAISILIMIILFVIKKDNIE